MAKVVIEKEAPFRDKAVDETESGLPGTVTTARLEAIWGNKKDIAPANGPPERSVNWKLAIFLLALSLASLVGTVVDMGLRYGFSKPWLWEW